MTPAQQCIAEAKAERLELPLAGGAFLRPLEVDEVVDAYIDGLNHPAVRRFILAARQQQQTRETVTAFVAANHAASDAILFGIFHDERLRGTLRLHDCDREIDEAWLGIALFDTAVWGLGLGRRAIAAAVDFAFRNSRLQRINAGIESDNIGSLKAFAAAGFEKYEDRTNAEGLAVEYWARYRCDGEAESTG